MEATTQHISSIKEDKDPNIHCAVESQWMLTILEDLGAKLNLTSILFADIMKDPIITTLDADMVIALKEHFNIEKQYEAALEIIKNGEGNDNSADQLKNISDVFNDSTRIVVRLLKMNPSLMRRLRETCPRRPRASHEFISTFQSLRRLMQSKLRMTADEERTSKEQLEQLQLQEKQDHARFIQLHDKLAVDSAAHADILLQKDTKIQELTSQIDELKSSTKLRRANRDKKEKDEIEASTKAFDSMERQLKAEIAKLELDLETKTADAFASEIQKTRQKRLRKVEIENKIAVYDKEMETCHKDQSRISLEFAKESRELKKLMLYFDKRDEETQRQDAEIKHVLAARAADLQILRREHENALLTQEVFAGFVKMKAKSDEAAAKPPPKKK